MITSVRGTAARYLAVGAVVCTVSLVACNSGSNSNSNTGATKASTTAGAAASPGGADSGSGGAKAGSVIEIGSWAPMVSPVYREPQYKAGMEAAIASVNAAGGVKGHMLKLTFCDSQYTVNGEAGCARQMVSAHVAVVVGPDLQVDQSGTEWKLLQAAKIPVLGSNGGSPTELNATNVYPLAGGVPAAFAGLAAGIVNAGSKKIAIMIDTNPTGAFAAQLITAALKPASLSPVRTVTADASSDPTFATAAAKTTAGGVDGVLLVGAPVNVAKMVGALRSGGYKGNIATYIGLFPQESIDALKSAAEGVILDAGVVLPNDDSNVGVQKFRADMSKYQPSAVVDDRSLYAWTAVQLFVKAAAGAQSYDSPGLTAAFDAVKTPIDISTIGPWAVVGKVGQVPGFSRILNPDVVFAVVKDGKVVSDGTGFVNPYTALNAN